MRSRGLNKRYVAMTAGSALALLAGYIGFAAYMSGDGDVEQVNERTDIDLTSRARPKPEPEGYDWLPRPEPKKDVESRLEPAALHMPPLPHTPPPVPYSPPPPPPQHKIAQNRPIPQKAPPPPQKREKRDTLLFGETDFGNGGGVMLATNSGGGRGNVSNDGDDLPEYARQGLASDKTRFIRNAGKDGSGVLTNSLQPALSDMILQTGDIIQAAARNATTTDLPGYIVADISYDVKDSLTRSCTLIPAGARIIGPINPQVAYGGELQQTAWTRVHLPNGEWLDLDSMPGTNSLGRAGLDGRVNHHYGKMTLAVLGQIAMTMLSQSGQLINGNGGEVTVVGLGGQATGSSVSTFGNEIIRRELDRQNEITLEPGDGVSLLVTRDVALPPYDGECS